MRILFLQENGYYESIGVMYISAFLKRSGHTVELFIAAEERHLFNRIKEFAPDLIAVSATTDMHSWVITMAKACKKMLNVPMMIGGPHPTCFPEIIKSRNIDMICQGEGEYALVEYANRFDSGGDLTSVPGIWVKRHRKVIPNPPGNLIQDFSDFPLPDRQLYYKYPFIKDMPMKRFITGRGCPFYCAFCHNQLLKGVFAGKGAYVRKMPVQKIIQEIREVRKQYPVKSIHFSDDTFVLNRQWVIDFCKIYKRKVGIPFSCNVRADLVNEPLVRVLRTAGCHAVSFGVESGNEAIRNRVLHKNISDNTILRAVDILRKYNIRFLTTNMVGVPGETIESVYDTIRFNRRIQADFTRCFIFDAFPGLPLSHEAVRMGLLPRSYSLRQFTALSHRPIIRSVRHDSLRNICSLFPVLVMRYIPERIAYALVNLPHTRVTYILGRLQQAYVEMRFFRIQLVPGLRYAFHTLRSFHSN